MAIERPEIKMPGKSPAIAKGPKRTPIMKGIPRQTNAGKLNSVRAVVAATVMALT